jgi:hypothetical protein
MLMHNKWRVCFKTIYILLIDPLDGVLFGTFVDFMHSVNYFIPTLASGRYT